MDGHGTHLRMIVAEIQLIEAALLILNTNVADTVVQAVMSEAHMLSTDIFDV